MKLSLRVAPSLFNYKTNYKNKNCHFLFKKNSKSRNAQLEFFSKYAQKPPQIFGRKFENLFLGGIFLGFNSMYNLTLSRICKVLLFSF